MDIEKLKSYKISESSVLNETDKKHISNYKQLIKFFENAVQSSVNGGETNYSELHTSCIQCVRFLDNLILTYESSAQTAQAINSTIDKIIEDSKTKQESGNDRNNQSLL